LELQYSNTTTLGKASGVGPKQPYIVNRPTSIHFNKQKLPPTQSMFNIFMLCSVRLLVLFCVGYFIMVAKNLTLSALSATFFLTSLYNVIHHYQLKSTYHSIIDIWVKNMFSNLMLFLLYIRESNVKKLFEKKNRKNGKSFFF